MRTVPPPERPEQPSPTPDPSLEQQSPPRGFWAKLWWMADRMDEDEDG